MLTDALRLLPSLALALLVATQVGAADVYVSPEGDDAGPGTEARPFRSVQKAAAVMQPGDTCLIAAGTYRETVRPARSGEPDKPLRFQSQPGAKVVLSGTDPLPGPWERHEGSIYKLATDRKFIQLFVDGQMMLEARWPNSSLTDLMAPTRAAAGEGTGYEVLADPNLPPGDWNGAIVVIWNGQRWVNATRRITDYQAGKSFRFDRDFRPKDPDKYHQSDPYEPRAGNPYYLVGSLAGLDSPGEWFLDEQAGMLYLWTPDGDSPAGHVVEAKQRDYALDLSQLGYVEVRGLDILGAAVNMTDAHDCLLEDCRLRYVEHIRECDQYQLPAPKNVVTGKNNEWRKCLIAYGATTGLRLAGEGNRLVDCIAHDLNYFGTGRGGLDLSNSVGAQVLRSTICRAGRDTIQHGASKRIRIEYCDLYHGNMLNADAGAIYCWGTDGEGGVIAHNLVHDNLGDSTCGIYLDNFSSNFIVHHNVVWNCTGSGIRLNSDALSHLVCHNTIARVREPFGTYCYAAYTPTMKGTRIINNLVNAPLEPKDPSAFVQGALGPELSHNGTGAVDAEGRPVAGSTAIDAGVPIAGLNDGFVGQAPDLGAYEFGQEPWTAGADWQDPELAALPAPDLSFAPRGPVTEETLPREGLALWLDATDAASLELGAQGLVRSWADRGPGKLVARPVAAARPVFWVDDALHGMPAVRGTGVGSLRVTDLKRGPGPVTMLMVSQGLEGAGPPWQRLIACFTGKGEEWVWPNWMVLRPGGEKPEAYTARVFVVQARDEAALDALTILGAGASDGQCLAGDVAEVLVYDRDLRFDELQAITDYLTEKWSLAQ